MLYTLEDRSLVCYTPSQSHICQNLGQNTMIFSYFDSFVHAFQAQVFKMPSLWKNLYSIQGIKHSLSLQLKIYLQIFFILCLHPFSSSVSMWSLAVSKHFRITQILNKRWGGGGRREEQ